MIVYTIPGSQLVHYMESRVEVNTMTSPARSPRWIDALSSLNKLLNDYVDLYCDGSLEFPLHKPKAEWLRGWAATRKDQKLSELYLAICRQRVDRKVLFELPEIVSEYEQYLELVKLNPSEADRYEEIFNTITQIPGELAQLLCTQTEESVEIQVAVTYSNDYAKPGKSVLSSIPSGLVACI